MDLLVKKYSAKMCSKLYNKNCTFLFQKLIRGSDNNSENHKQKKETPPQNCQLQVKIVIDMLV